MYIHYRERNPAFDNSESAILGYLFLKLKDLHVEVQKLFSNDRVKLFVTRFIELVTFSIESSVEYVMLLLLFVCEDACVFLIYRWLSTTNHSNQFIALKTTAVHELHCAHTDVYVSVYDFSAVTNKSKLA